MRFRDLPLAARWYVSAICLLALGLAGLVFANSREMAPLEMAALITIAAVIAHSFPVSTPGRQAYHVSLPFFVAAAVLLSPTQLLLAIGLVHVSEYWRRRRSAVVQVFNAAAYGVAALAAHATFTALCHQPAGAFDLAQPSCLVAGAAAALVFSCTNRLLVSFAIWLGNGISPREQHMFARESLLTDAILLLMGLPMAHLAVIAPWASAAGAAPLLLIHRALDLPNVRAQRRQDGLTELFSAPYLNETCTRELNRANRFGRAMTLVLIDLDKLGELNASYGPDAGDAVIRGTATVIRKAIREYDLAARLAGGMFAVLLPETDMAQSQVVAERIRRSIAERRHELSVSLEQVRVTASIGVVVASGQSTSAAQVFAAAEAVLARAKRVGGNRSEFAELAVEASEPRNDVVEPEVVEGTSQPASTGSSLRVVKQAAVVSAAVLGCAAVMTGYAAVDWPLLGVLVMLLLVLERRAGEPMERSGLVLSCVPVVVGGMLTGTAGAALLAVAVGAARLIARRGETRRVIFETAVCVLLGVPAAQAFSVVGGLPLPVAAAIALPPMLMRYLSRRYVERAIDSVRKLRTLNEQLEHQAFHDPLTNLANRALFSERLDHALRRADDSSVAVLFLDLDDFKTVNDTLGHAAGDALLTVATQRLRQCVRWEDTIARLGGDEFTILLENVRDVSQAARSAERISEALRQPFVLDGQEARVSASIGIALDTDRSHLPEDLLREADLAMYRAKSGGKARYEIFDPSMGSDVMERLDLETDLRAALEAGEVEVRYEHAADAYVRTIAHWHHPRRGPLEGAVLRALADEAGVAADLARWTLRRACEHAAVAHLSVAVPVSPQIDLGLLDDVAELLAETLLPASRLRLEMTSGMVSIELLASLTQLGVSFAFGDDSRAEVLPVAA